MSKLPRLLPLIAVAIGGLVVVRAVGAAPGLFDGAKAWAEEAMPAAAEGAPAPARSAPAVCALSPEQLAQQAGISPAELRIIQGLSQRRGELDARDQDFATMLPLMVAAEQKLDAKLQAMQAIKAEVNALLGQVDEKQKAEIDRLVSVYSAMRPKEAAAVFTSLNDSVRLPVAAAMRPRSLAAIMAQMPPAAARELTEKLARRFEAQQQLAARAAAASAPPAAAPAGVQPPAATPTQAAAAPAAQPPAAQPTPQPAAPPTRRAQPQPQRAAARPTQPRRQPPAEKSAGPTGPQPYQAAAAPASGTSTGTAPRQSVQ